MIIEFGSNSYIKYQTVGKIAPSLNIGKNSVIVAENVSIDEDVIIGANTIISAKTVSLGKGSQVENNCRIMLKAENSKFSLGDNCFIGNESTILIPVFETGDYVVLHNHLLANGVNACKIGHNVWIGQNCILNANDSITIGNNVGIGAYTSIYTHGFWGEKIEGCQLTKVAPVIIEDDVWIVGSYNTISPNVKIGKKAVILSGSVVTKDVSPNRCVAGIPANDITDKVTPYREITVNEKYSLMRDFMSEFLATIADKTVKTLSNGWEVEGNGEKYAILFVDSISDSVLADDFAKIIFTKENKQHFQKYCLVSIFDLSTKKYTKMGTKIESQIIRFLLPYRARFIPYS